MPPKKTKDLNLTAEQQQARFNEVLHPPAKRKTLTWAMTLGANEPQFLCSAKSPHAIEYVNAAWCDLTGFASHMIKGSHGLSLLKGPQTDEDLVASAWIGKERTITVIHYTAGGSVVDHTVHIIPIVAEKSDVITHFLGMSSFEKHMVRGNLFHQAKKVVASQHFTVPTPPDLAGPAVIDQELAKIDPADRPKNIYQLRKENALKHLSEYADRLSESVKSQVQLTSLKNWPPDTGSSRADSRGMQVSDTADRINSWKARFNTARTASKREKEKEKRRKAAQFAAAEPGNSGVPARLLTGCESDSVPPTPLGNPVTASTAADESLSAIESPPATSNTRGTRVSGPGQILLEGEEIQAEGAGIHIFDTEDDANAEDGREYLKDISQGGCSGLLPDP